MQLKSRCCSRSTYASGGEVSFLRHVNVQLGAESSSKREGCTRSRSATESSTGLRAQRAPADAFAPFFSFSPGMQIYRCALVFAARTESNFCKRPRAAAADGVTRGVVFTADWVGASRTTCAYCTTCVMCSVHRERASAAHIGCRSQVSFLLITYVKICKIVQMCE